MKIWRKTMTKTTNMNSTIERNSTTLNSTNNLDSLTIMTNFRNYVAKKNRILKGWLVIWFSAIGTLLINGVADYEEKGHHLFLTCLAACLLFLAGCGYVSKYTNQGKLAEIMRSHAFDAKTYFGLLFKKLVPLQIGSFFILLFAGILQKSELKTILLFECLLILLPQLAILLKYIAFEKSQQVGLLWPALISAGRYVEMFARIIALGAAFIEFGIFFVDTFGIHPITKSVNDGIAASFQFHDDLLLIICFLTAALASLFFTDNGVETPHFAWIKFRKISVIGLILISIASGAFYCYSIRNDYVCLMEDSITVKAGDTTKTYALDEISSYRIFANDLALAMEVTFTDGTRQKLFTDSSEETKAWSDKYDNTYSYVSFLTQNLKSLGINGTLEDADVLDDTVKTNSPTIQADYETIKRNVLNP